MRLRMERVQLVDGDRDQPPAGETVRVVNELSPPDAGGPAPVALREERKHRSL